MPISATRQSTAGRQPSQSNSVVLLLGATLTICLFIVASQPQSPRLAAAFGEWHPGRKNTAPLAPALTLSTSEGKRATPASRSGRIKQHNAPGVDGSDRREPSDNTSLRPPLIPPPPNPHHTHPHAKFAVCHMLILPRSTCIVYCN